MRFPRKMSGNSPMGSEWNAMVDCLKYIAPATGAGSRYTSSPHGTFRSVSEAIRRAGTGGGGGLSVKWCQIQSIEKDHYVVKEWDWTEEDVTGSEFNVAKSYDLRGVWCTTGKTVGSVSYTFTDETSDTTYIERTADDGTNSELQVVVPPFEDDGSIIIAIQVAHSGVEVDSTELVWLDLNNDGRAWARKFDQS